ncbi:hypothetical protein GF361_02230 [Candidatus Woesearchaeota archaeon]|nr:hypothetical protein [Candidatus Woesearchaeota archaeon]
MDKKKIIKNKIKKIKNINKKLHKGIKQHKKFLKAAKKNIKSKKIMAAGGLIVILLILAVGFNLNRFLLDQSNIAATINGEKVTMDELDHEYDFFFFIMGYPESYKQMITKESFLEQMINERLLIQKAVEDGISVLDKEVDEKLEKMISNSPVSKDQFEIQLNTAGFTMKDLFDYYKKQVIISELLNKSFSDIRVSNEEAKTYYNENKDLYTAGEGEIRLRHILVNTKPEAKEILENLKSGEDFIGLAREESIGPSSVEGGDLGFVSKGQMVKEFEEVAFKLNENQISEIVKTQYGYHIIKRESDLIKFTEVKNTIINTLETERQKQELGEYLEDIKERSDIVINFGQAKTSGTAVPGSCYNDYGLSSDTVIFYHADWCPHCSRMISVVEELEGEGYKFHWAETSSGEGEEVVDSCFGDVLQGGVPQFICTGNKDYKLGEISEESLRKFAESCQ